VPLLLARQTLTALAEELDGVFLEGNVRRCELLSLLKEWDAAKEMCSSVIDSPVSARVASCDTGREDRAGSDLTWFCVA
jgi:hypothetical protein